jgi:hypothetical protein
LLPDPRLDRVWLSPACAGEATALRAIGAEVVTDLGDGADVAFVDGLRCDFHAIEGALPPGALVRVTVADSSERRWGIAKELEARGWHVLVRVWAIGGIDGAFGYVDVDDRHAVMQWWRLLQPKGVRERLSVAVRLAVGRVGLWRLLCREGFLLARTPV